MARNGTSRRPGWLAAVLPYVSAVCGHLGFIENSIFVSSVQAVAASAQLRAIRQAAYQDVRVFRGLEQVRRTTQDRRRMLETIADQLGDLELELSYSDEGSAGRMLQRLDPCRATPVEPRGRRDSALTGHNPTDQLSTARTGVAVPPEYVRRNRMRIGDLHLHPISDGTFIARPQYFGNHLAPQSRPELFSRHQAAWLPIGCFLVRASDRLVLIDAGLGPELRELPYGMHLVGGQLLTGLRALRVTTTDITDVICSHFHSDHVGWLFDLGATIWFGTADWPHFVTGTGDMLTHIREGLRTPAHAPRIRPINHDTTIAPGITTLPAPGHTPGHICIVISSGHQRALLLGDAITCPIQLDEPSWHSMADVDPALAGRTRQRLWRELEDERTTGAGAHFPELQFGRVLPGTARRWFT